MSRPTMTCRELVGLVTSTSDGTRRARHSARAKNVLPVPRSPESTTRPYISPDERAAPMSRSRTAASAISPPTTGAFNSEASAAARS